MSTCRVILFVFDYIAVYSIVEYCIRIGVRFPLSSLVSSRALFSLPFHLIHAASISGRLSYSKYACSVSTGQITNEAEKGVVVCGTVGEVANDITLGGNDGFDIKTDTTKKMNRDIYLGGEFMEYKNTVWADIALYSKDQLRQRMAWALYQIIPIGIPDTDVWMTETWLQYYDIFVRNAFGNYRDVLKQISFTDVMANWLSFTNNYSLQYNIERNGLEIYPDEVSYCYCHLRGVCSQFLFFQPFLLERSCANFSPLFSYSYSIQFNFIRFYSIRFRIMPAKLCNCSVLEYFSSIWMAPKNLMRMEIHSIPIRKQILSTWREHGLD